MVLLLVGLLNKTLIDHIQQDDDVQIYCWFCHLHNAHTEEDEHDDDDDDKMVTRVLFFFPFIEDKLHFSRVVKYQVIYCF